jgi:hypothetical protein
MEEQPVLESGGCQTPASTRNTFAENREFTQLLLACGRVKYPMRQRMGFDTVPAAEGRKFPKLPARRGLCGTLPAPCCFSF